MERKERNRRNEREVRNERNKRKEKKGKETTSEKGKARSRRTRMKDSVKNGAKRLFGEEERKRNFVILGVTVVVLVAVYLLTQSVSPDYLKELGLTLPLPVFTFLVAIVDGFNPCNLFVLTMLLSLMVSASHSRKRIFGVGYSFVFVVYVFYFLFMAAWLNIFKYIGFITPLRLAIAGIAIIAGAINCKELFFYRKGITLMVQDQHVGPLKRRINKFGELIKKASMPALIGSSLLLGVFSSFVELPCTAGFPIIYTGILTGAYLEHSLLYYAYLVLYNAVYVLPLVVAITVFGFTLKGKQIKKKTMALIKFIGGAIMLLLGLILVFSPGIIGVG